MALHVDLRHDLNRLQGRLEQLPRERLQAAVRALNRTMVTVRAQAARDMGAAYPGLRIAAVKSRIKFTRATRTKAAAALTFSAKRFRLISFGVRQGAAGVRGRVPWGLETGDGLRLTQADLQQAFIRTSRQYGVANVFRRVGRERYPITVVLAPSLASAFRELSIGDRLAKLARERFAVVFAQEAAFRLSRRAA